MTEATVKNVSFKHERITVDLSDGRTITVPLDWFPRLADAPPQALTRWEISAAGHGIHWPELDEDISIEGLLFGSPSAEAKTGLPKHS